ncbi:MAG: anthranilate phosphoribosyltransferase [Phycisphaerae bacterium]|nr:anthranilate phosphoribosyltransferase [Phycisphaerae bacterium]
MTALLSKLVAGNDLTEEETYAAFDRIMSGDMGEVEMAALLVGLAAKGETTDEIVGAARVMREKVIPIPCSADCIDTCGTGGDGISTFNVSTTAAIIAAGAGATVAKHGNRTNTRACGSAEVVQALGVNLDADVPVLQTCLARCRIAFLFAPRLHPAMKYAAPVRQALRIRTIFNLLGPLTNPAGARRQVIGVPRAELTEQIAGALRSLGAIRALVVHGADGLCDLTITGPTRITELRNGQIRTYDIQPEDAGLERAPLDTLLVKSPQESAAAIEAILDGKLGPRRNHALLNAAAALLVAELAEDLRDGVRRAKQAIDSKAARHTLDELVRLSGGS